MTTAPYQASRAAAVPAKVITTWTTILKKSCATRRSITIAGRPLLKQIRPNSLLTDSANLLIMANLDAANITFNAPKIVAGHGVTVGPMLLGAARPVHILTPTSTIRRILNMTALTAVGAASTKT